MNRVLHHCPQCGQDSLGQPAHAHPCPGCRTLLVHVGGLTKEAHAFDGRTFPSESQTLALVCRTCGGAWPEEVTGNAAGAKCSYCGVPATLPPGLLVLLRLAVTHPGALPQTTRRFFFAWAAVWAFFAVIAILHGTRPSPALHEEHVIAVPQAAAQDENAPVRRYVLNIPCPAITVKPRGNTFINATVWADALQDAHLRLKVIAVQSGTGAVHETWISLWDGEAFREQSYLPASHRYAGIPFSHMHGTAIWPPGTYRLIIQEALVRGGALPSQLRVEWTSWSSPGHVWLLLLAMILVACFVKDIQRVSRDPLRGRRIPTPWMLLGLAGCVFVLVNDLHPLPGFFEQGKFIEVNAGAG